MGVAEEVAPAPVVEPPAAPTGGGRRAALRRPHVARVLATSLVARLPTAMGTLVLLLLIAPGLAQLYQRIAAAAPAGSQTEAFGWLAMAFIVGSALGGSLGGACVAGLGARAALGLAALPPLAGCLVAALLHRRPAPRLPSPQSPSSPPPSSPSPPRR